MQTAYAELECTAGTPWSVEDEQKHLLAYVPLVKRVVRQLGAQAAGSMDRDDMYQVGLLGLLDALRRYGEPDEKFAGYATTRVRGAILDELRRLDWRPRSVRQETHRVRDGVRNLARTLGREPTQAEVLERLQLTPEAYREFQLAENAEQLAQFDDVIQELPDLHEEGRFSPEAQLFARRSIEEALRTLDEREQRVVQLYYEFELSLREIAAVLGLTEARVCQINKAALRKMRGFLLK
ncbi:MAG TPA: RNA polymerase sigma factor FliA [Polyangiaceae bacterium]|nr:RNA polymerase sigma factor FliA [Polyangiaceae bacterium]